MPAAAALIIINTVVLLIAAHIGETRAADTLLTGAVALCCAWLVGDDVRVRRASAAMMERTVLRLRADQDEQARRAVAEERARIARELHDIVAYQVTLIAVRAGSVADQAAPGPVREALDVITAAGRAALTELRALLGMLNPDGADRTAAPRQAPPRLAALENLVGEINPAATLHVTGARRPLPPSLELCAYRIVQEALTNAQRHGTDGAVLVSVDFGPDLLAIEVTNNVSYDPPPQSGEPGGYNHQPESGERGNYDRPPQSDGRGLIGMRERAKLFSGSLTAGPDFDGRFRVVARLPIGNS